MKQTIIRRMKQFVPDVTIIELMQNYTSGTVDTLWMECNMFITVDKMEQRINEACEYYPESAKVHLLSAFRQLAEIRETHLPHN